MAEKTEKKTSSIPAMSPAFDCLAVTNVQVFPFKEGANLGHMKGLASIVLNDQNPDSRAPRDGWRKRYVCRVSDRYVL